MSALPDQARRARCTICGELFTADTLTGPLPRICDPCDPAAAAKRREDREKNRANARRRSDRLAELEQQVRFLAARLNAATEETRADRLQTLSGEVDRATLARAVRAVADARGHEATRDALLHLADVAEAFASRLGIGPQGAAIIEGTCASTLRTQLGAAA